MHDVGVWCRVERVVASGMSGASNASTLVGHYAWEFASLPVAESTLENSPADHCGEADDDDSDCRVCKCVHAGE